MLAGGGAKIIVTPLKKRNDQKDDTGVKMGSEERTHPHPPIRGLEVLLAPQRDPLHCPGHQRLLLNFSDNFDTTVDTVILFIHL